MNVTLILATIVLLSGAGFLTWLQVSNKVPLPLIFEAGLLALVLGLVAVWDSMIDDRAINPNGLLGIGLGLLLVVGSYFRQSRRHNQAQRRGPPRVIEGHHLGKINGGKQ